MFRPRIRALPLVTLPPFWIASEPAPVLPTLIKPPSVQVDPAPVTVTMPLAVEPPPMLVPVLIKLPPFATVSVPLPELPTLRALLLFHVEPGSVTVTIPVEPPKAPMMLGAAGTTACVKAAAVLDRQRAGASFTHPKLVIVRPGRTGAIDVYGADTRRNDVPARRCC